MSDPQFFRRAAGPSLAELVKWTGAAAFLDGRALEAAPDLAIIGVAPLDTAGPGDLVFLDNPKYAGDLAKTKAAAVLLEQRYVARVPAGVVALAVAEPYRAMAGVMARLYPEAARPMASFGSTGVSPGSSVHPLARLEAGVTVDPGAVIGPRAEIGAGSVVGANAVVGPDCRIGRDCSIGPNASVSHTLMGNRVIVHPGARLGQDGFGFAMGGRGHLKVPQIGRVVIQDDVEIGANTAIDRGANRDTVIGEGTKIDNLVQIAHNVTIGRHCVIVSQVGISGSTEIGDFTVIGGQVGVAGHLRIGAGVKVAACAAIMNDIPAGETWCGVPAQPIRDFWRELAVLRKLAADKSGTAKAKRET